MDVRAQPLDLAIAKLASQQHGVVSHAQLVELGCNRGSLDTRVAGGRLHRLHTGVYSVGHSVLPRWGPFIAAVLACGPGALLSHVSAATLWGLLQNSSSRVHVSAPGRGKHRRAGIKLHLPRSIHPEDRAVREGIPVTSIARTLLDLAAVLPYPRLLRAVEEAERLRLFDLGAVERLLARSRGRKGGRALRSAIAESVHDVHWTRSELERRFLGLCRSAGLPQPAVNYWLEGLEVDAVWLEQKLAVELDGWATHHGRGAFERDRKRDAKLQLAGYRVMRVTQRRIERDAEELAGELRTLLGLTAPRARAGSRGC
jgi:hypothetical protein